MVPVVSCTHVAFAAPISRFTAFRALLTTFLGPWGPMERALKLRPRGDPQRQGLSGPRASALLSPSFFGFHEQSHENKRRAVARRAANAAERRAVFGATNTNRGAAILHQQFSTRRPRHTDLNFTTTHRPAQATFTTRARTSSLVWPHTRDVRAPKSPRSTGIFLHLGLCQFEFEFGRRLCRGGGGGLSSARHPRQPSPRTQWRARVLWVSPQPQRPPLKLQPRARGQWGW